MIHTASFIASIAAMYSTLIKNNVSVYYCREDYEIGIPVKVKIYLTVKQQVSLSLIKWESVYSISLSL